MATMKQNIANQQAAQRTVQDVRLQKQLEWEQTLRQEQELRLLVQQNEQRNAQR